MSTAAARKQNASKCACFTFGLALGGLVVYGATHRCHNFYPFARHNDHRNHNMRNSATNNVVNADNNHNNFIRRSSDVQSFCPAESDMNIEYGQIKYHQGDAGWTMSGDGRVSSKTSWNLLGGSIEFDMDTTGVADEVNTNLYTTSPSQPNCGKDCYCDIQQSPTGKPSCMELDLIEANGNCAMATTIHTFATDGKPNNPDCDRWGCGSTAKLPGTKFHIKAEFDEDGTTTVYLNGDANNQYNQQPSAASNQKVVETMQSIGAVIESSQWFGWAPAEDQCPKGDQSGLNHSTVSISNLVVRGSVIQGPTPKLCQ